MAEEINKIPQRGATTFGRMRGTYNPGITVGHLIHPALSDLLDADELDDPFTNLQAKLGADANASRAFMLGPYHQAPTNNGEDVNWLTRSQHKYLTQPGTNDYIYELIGTYAEAKALRRHLEGKAGLYKATPVDENGAMRFNRSSTDGINGFDTIGLEMLPNIEKMEGDLCRYRVRVALANIKQFNEADHLHITNADGEVVDVFDKLNGLRGVEPGRIFLAATSPNLGTLYIGVEGSEGEENFVDLLKGATQLKRVEAWVLTLANGTAVTITAVDIVVVNNKNLYFELTLDTLDYTTGDTAYLTGAAVSVLFGYTGRYLEFNNLPLTLTK